MLLSGNMTRLGDAYLSGELTVTGSVQDILSVGMALADRIGRSPWVARLARVIAWIPRRHSRRQDAAAIRHHYDVSNEFFALWLDRNMVYSCAYFRTGTEDIDTAQDGAMLNHGIILTDPDGNAQGPIGGEFIERHVFPGGELAPLPRVLNYMARYRTGLIPRG